MQTILIHNIDLSDETFSTNFRPDLQALRYSIKEFGLIQPVLLRKKGSRYQIISGYRRIAVLNELGIREVASRLFEKEEKDDLQLFSLALHENMTTRGL
ncbi:MAG: ParB/RepB/Spo0J family partition protein, partial [Thermodesulfobacteriota bacterium]